MKLKTSKVESSTSRGHVACGKSNLSCRVDLLIQVDTHAFKAFQLVLPRSGLKVADRPDRTDSELDQTA